MTDRELKLHVARVQLAECARRRDRVNRFFYWTLFNYAQKCRRQAAAMSPTPEQRGLFA